MKTLLTYIKSYPNKVMPVKQIAVACLVLAAQLLPAQTPSKKQTLAVLNIDSKGVATDPSTMGNMVRIELEKLDIYDVMDKYDVIHFMEKNKISPNNCYGKTCLTEMGQLLKTDKMFSGSVEQMGKTIVITYRLLDVATASVEKTYVHEFLYIPEELQSMIKLSIAEMYGKPLDVNLMNKLSKKYDFDNSNNNPQLNRLRLDGPRMGFTSYSGELKNRMTAPKSEGGFDIFPVMFQFGYQFEKQYLNEGKVQALFEFIPMVTGLDQGYFIPSVTLLHGIRSNVNGWEFAFGPTFNVITVSKGYYDENNKWQLERHWGNDSLTYQRPNPYPIKERVDSRGDVVIRSSFVLAAGRTFKSGKLNIPVNIFVIPGSSGWRFGLSMGFNAKN